MRDAQAAVAGVASLATSPDSRALIKQIEEHLAVAPLGDLTSAFVAVLDQNAGAQGSLGGIARALAFWLSSEEERAPGSVPEALWRDLGTVADRLCGAGLGWLGRLPFISDRLVELMVAEARLQLPDRSEATRRTVAAPGPALASLALSAKLSRAVGSALGYPVEPIRQATYMYDPPGSYVAPHLDNDPYEVIFHLVLEHQPPPDGTPTSALVAYLPSSTAPAVSRLRPGDGVALCGRGTLHYWQRLKAGESRVLIGVGFRAQPAVD